MDDVILSVGAFLTGALRQSYSTEAVFLLLVFGAVALLVAAIAGAFSARNVGMARLTAGPRAINERGPGVVIRNDNPNSAFDALMKKFERNVLRLSDREKHALQLRMIRAGYMSSHAVTIYFIARAVLGLALPALFLLVVAPRYPGLSQGKLLLSTIGACGLGVYLPYRWVQSKLESRQRAITEGFPDALDMLVVCVEAGLGMDAAFLRVSQQMSRSHPELSELIGLIGLELRAGRSREEALQNFGRRTGVQDVSSFIALLIQSEKLGTDLAQTLRVQADEMRAKRMLRAEEIAHKLPVKLAIPLVICILPAMFAVVLGPAIISIVRNVLPHLGGKV